jgi:hypothetical protein
MVFESLQEKIETHKVLAIEIGIILALLPISYIGWQVHYLFIEVLGLPPLMSWKIPYWIAEMGVASLYGVIGAIGYWMVEMYYHRAKWTAFMIGISSFYYWACGVFDWLWFLIHGLLGHVAEFPGLMDIWWWNPYYWFLGIEWTTLHHIIYTIVLVVMFAFAWIIWDWKVNK